MQASRLIQVAATIVMAITVVAVQAAPQKIEQLPRVVITGKSVPAGQQLVVQQLPRVVIEGRSMAAQQLAAAKAARRI